MPPANEGAVPPAGFMRPGSVRGRTGFFHAGQDAAGRWWLADAEGAPFFLRGVHGVKAAQLGAGDALPPDSLTRLREWGFNAVGLGDEAAPGREDGWPFLASAELAEAGRIITGGGLRLPDVFDPEWPQLIAARAREICAPQQERRELIGWVSDGRLAWGLPTAAGRPSLLQVCLSLEPTFPAYHAAWEFALALHGGRLAALAQAWDVPMANKEVVRELTRAERGLRTKGYLRDDLRWAREFARRYFAGAGPAIRAADPNHLVLGCRFDRPVGAAVLGACVYPAVDVALPHWVELPAPAGVPAHPVIAGEVNWVGAEFLQPLAGVHASRLTTVERMLRRARQAIDRVARHPAVVGYAWAHWEDEPGERAPFGSGLVHRDGTDAPEHAELLAAFNARAAGRRPSSD
jgi:agarase